jgi:hypothetical protein
MSIHLVFGNVDFGRCGIRRAAIAVFVALSLTACADAGPRSNERQALTPADVYANPLPRSMSMEEQQIVDSLVNMFPQAASQVRSLLSDRRVAAMELPGAHAFALLARLDTIRMKGPAMSYVKSRSPAVHLATVVLVKELEDSTADVVVVRRTRPAADMIVMREKNAKGALLGAGIAALFKLRKQFGDSATQDMHIAVHNARMPKKWPEDLKRETERIIADLRKEEKKAVRGLGKARSVEIPLVATAP